MSVRFEVYESGIRIITPISIFTVSEEYFLPVQQALKEALFEWCKMTGKRLGDVGDRVNEKPI